MMLSVLPFLSFAATLYLLRVRDNQLDFRLLTLRAALLTGIYAVISLELLSLVQGISQVGIAFVWGMSLLLVLILLVREHRLIHPFPAIQFGLSDLPWLGVAGMLLAALLVAWYAPVQTWDSLNYHMPRVAHWAQQRSIAHFETGIYKQVGFSPGAEMLILHGYVLAQSDRLANLVQWASMLGSVLALSYLAKQLGGKRLAQSTAALFGATLPMGFAEATSTMNDYVLGFWVLCAAVESFSLYTRQEKTQSLGYLCLAAALAVLTKPTCVAYLSPFALLVFIFLVRHLPMRQALLWVITAIMLVLLVNGGHWIRNTITFGDPIASQQFLSWHTNVDFWPKTLLSNLVRNAGLHAVAPWDGVKEFLSDMILRGLIKLGINPNDPSNTFSYYTGVPEFSFHEDVIGNPLHGVLILFLFLLFVLLWRRQKADLRVYCLLMVGTFLLFSWIFRWQAFGSRLHMPFFLLAAPFVGVFMERHLGSAVTGFVCLALFVMGTFMGLQIRSRPVFPRADFLHQSIFVESRMDLGFANGPNQKVYEAIVGRIRDAGCDSVGLMISGDGAEYPFWVLLGAPDDSLQIEWIVSGPTARHRVADFSACAVICQKCPPEWEYVRDLPLVYEQDGDQMRLYLHQAP